jgi:transposase
MADTQTRERKREVLAAHGALYHRPGAVLEELYAASDFFDPHDWVQVKYEMLRAHQGGKTASAAARSFGFSRPSFYQAQEALLRDGLAGLLPKRRGPKGAHKLTSAVMDYVQELKQGSTELGSRRIAELVHERFGLRVHPRSIERALVRLGKRRRRAH